MNASLDYFIGNSIVPSSSTTHLEVFGRFFVCHHSSYCILHSLTKAKQHPTGWVWSLSYGSPRSSPAYWKKWQPFLKMQTVNGECLQSQFLHSYITVILKCGKYASSPANCRSIALWNSNCKKTYQNLF